jgi:hypothetical protein
VRKRCHVRAALIEGDFLGKPLVRMALRKHASAASRSRVGVRRKSIVWPSLSTARDKYAHFPRILT